jgi:hypothetical protein
VRGALFVIRPFRHDERGSGSHQPMTSRCAREHTARHADDLYELISDRAVNGKPLILTSNRSPKAWYNLFPNPVVAESLLDRLINTSHQILMDGPTYRPRKRPGATAPVDNTKTTR